MELQTVKDLFKRAKDTGRLYAGKWNYEEDVVFAFANAIITEPARSTFWSKPLVGEKRQVVVVQRVNEEKDYFWILDNQTGTGFLKIQGGGHWRLGHADLNNCKFVNMVEMLDEIRDYNAGQNAIDERKYKKHMKENHPVEFEILEKRFKIPEGGLTMENIKVLNEEDEMIEKASDKEGGLFLGVFEAEVHDEIIQIFPEKLNVSDQHGSSCQSHEMFSMISFTDNNIAYEVLLNQSRTDELLMSLYELYEESVLGEVDAEMRRQFKKWGEQNHPILNGVPEGCTNNQYYLLPEEASINKLVEQVEKEGCLSYMHILVKQVSKVANSFLPEEAREQLIKVAAVSASMVEAIDRKLSKERIEQISEEAIQEEEGMIAKAFDLEAKKIINPDASDGFDDWDAYVHDADVGLAEEE